MNNLKKLTKPSVLLGLLSQFTTVLLPFSRNVYVSFVQVCLSLFIIILSILSNPHTKTKSFGDDIYFCEGCSKKSVHIYANKKLVCKGCGYTKNPNK